MGYGQLVARELFKLSVAYCCLFTIDCGVVMSRGSAYSAGVRSENLVLIDILYANEQWVKLRRPGALQFVRRRLSQLSNSLGEKPYLDGVLVQREWDNRLWSLS
jgi:hypothetical protein